MSARERTHVRTQRNATHARARTRTHTRARIPALGLPATQSRRHSLFTFSPFSFLFSFSLYIARFQRESRARCVQQPGCADADAPRFRSRSHPPPVDYGDRLRSLRRDGRLRDHRANGERPAQREISPESANIFNGNFPKYLGLYFIIESNVIALL